MQLRKAAFLKKSTVEKEVVFTCKHATRPFSVRVPLRVTGFAAASTLTVMLRSK